MRVLPVQSRRQHFVKNDSADSGEDRFALCSVGRAVLGEEQLDAVVQLELPGTVRGEDFIRVRITAVIPRLAANLIK